MRTNIRAFRLEIELSCLSGITKSLAVATDLFWAGVVGALGNIGAFVFYARLLNVLSFVLIFFLMPGTEIIHQFFSFFLRYVRKALDIKEKEKPFFALYFFLYTLSLFTLTHDTLMIVIHVVVISTICIPFLFN